MARDTNYLLNYKTGVVHRNVLGRTACTRKRLLAGDSGAVALRLIDATASCCRIPCVPHHATHLLAPPWQIARIRLPPY